MNKCEIFLRYVIFQIKCAIVSSKFNGFLLFSYSLCRETFRGDGSVEQKGHQITMFRKQIFTRFLIIDHLYRWYKCWNWERTQFKVRPTSSEQTWLQSWTSADFCAINSFELCHWRFVVISGIWQSLHQNTPKWDSNVRWKMLSEKEKHGIAELLGRMASSDLNSLAQTVTLKFVTPQTPSEAVTSIILHTDKASGTMP